MQSWPTAILGLLAQAALIQLISLLVLRSLIRRVAPESPATCRAACLLVVLQGCFLVPLTVSVPWYDPPEEEVSACAWAVLPEGHATTGGDSTRFWTRSWNADARIGDRAGFKTAKAERTQAALWSGLAALACPLLMGAWLVGIIVLAGCTVLRYAWFVGTRPRRLPCPQAWQEEWHDLWKRYGAGREIPLEITQRHGPVLCLFPWGYRLLVPQAFWRASTPRQRAAVLRHEIAHWRRGDVWKSWLVRVLALPQWFNPAAWWAVSTFEECAEWSCDRFAAATGPERTDYARALQRLAAIGLPFGVAGRCVHCHPLVTRIRFLLRSPSQERFAMRKIVIVAIAGTLMLVQGLRVELVAKGEELTQATAEEKIGKMDEQIEKVSASLKELGEKAEALKEEIEARLADLKEGGDQLDSISNEAQRRIALFQMGGEDGELEAVKGLEKLGDEGIILLSLAAENASYKSVRRKVLETALKLDRKGYPILVSSYESLPEEDRVFLAEGLGKGATEDDLIALVLLAREDESAKVRKAALESGLSSAQKLLFAAAMAVDASDELICEMVEIAAKIKGEDGLLLLYAAAKGEPVHQIAAMKAAVSHKQNGLMVLTPTFETTDPKVRAQGVCTAKLIGGDLAQLLIEEALYDEREEMRKAAEQGLKDAEAQIAKKRKAAKEKKPNKEGPKT
jgi:beta-lactamase regulating signal transducer with metallopeptidase domain